MKETRSHVRQGEVVPFARSTDYWHRLAMDNRRSRRFPEAVALLRSAARLSPDNVEIQMDLAETLSEMECFEQSSRLLYRLLSRNPGLAECFWGLAVNAYGMQRMEEALDALSHYLRLAPDGPYADDAREMLQALVGEEGAAGSSRGELLIRRGLKAFSDDKPHKATEQLRRALRVSGDRARVRTMLSLSLLNEGKPREALRHAMAACAMDRRSVQARCCLCCALWMLKKPRAAAGMLNDAAKWCDSPGEELLFCHTASQLNQKELLLTFLLARSKWTPFRVGTLNCLAVAHYNLDQFEKAMAVFARVLQIDPENLQAEYGYGLCRKALKGEGGQRKVLGYHPILPREESKRRLMLIAAALSGGEEQLKARWHGDEELRKTVRWAFTLPDEHLHGALLSLLCGLGKDGAGLVKELLMDEGLSEEQKRRAVLLLNRMGEPMPYMLTYRRRITQVHCVPKELIGVPRWRFFLRMFLMEAGRHGDAAEAAQFALSLYRSLSGKMREEAAGEEALQWVKAFELLFLVQKGRREDAGRVAAVLPVSLRRILRIVRRIQKHYRENPN